MAADLFSSCRKALEKKLLDKFAPELPKIAAALNAASFEDAHGRISASLDEVLKVCDLLAATGPGPSAS